MPRDDHISDVEQKALAVGASMPAVRREGLADMVSLGLVVVLGAVAITGVIVGAGRIVTAASVIALVAFAFAGAYRHMMARPDHVRALQSDRMLAIANESLPYLRRGLDEDTAGHVCRIVLRESQADAVAITGSESVLGFAGIGEEHHLVGRSIITRATQEALQYDEPRILHTKEDIGCPEPTCRLRAAVVVPLEQRGEAVGTLKFYFTSDRFLNETQLAMAEGLARLLSTQLELAELEHQTELAREMELKALQAQINPHFLFNTINTIASFTRTDPSEAHRLLRRFGTFYRRTLDQANELVTVDRELEYVRSYLELEQARFGERLEVSCLVDPPAGTHPLPAFMLQPLVENSVSHGMRPDGSPLRITISAHIEGEVLLLKVADDGVGIDGRRLERIFDAGTATGLGIALRNVKDRVSGHFGPESELIIESESGAGTTVTLRITPLADGGYFAM